MLFVPTALAAEQRRFESDVELERKLRTSIDFREGPQLRTLVLALIAATFCSVISLFLQCDSAAAIGNQQHPSTGSAANRANHAELAGSLAACLVFGSYTTAVVSDAATTARAVAAGGGAASVAHQLDCCFVCIVRLAIRIANVHVSNRLALDCELQTNLDGNASRIGISSDRRVRCDFVSAISANCVWICEAALSFFSRFSRSCNSEIGRAHV